MQSQSQRFAQRLQAKDAELPDYLVEAIDRAKLTRYEIKSVTHRGEMMDSRALVDGCVSAVECRSEVASEVAAVDAMIDYLARSYSVWFGNLDSLSDEEAVAREWRVTGNDIRSRYWNGQCVEQMDPSDRGELKSIAKGVVSVLLEQLTRQQAADEEARCEAVQTEVRNEALRQLYRRDAEPAEIRGAVEDAIEHAEERGWLDE